MQDALAHEDAALDQEQSTQSSLWGLWLNRGRRVHGGRRQVSISLYAESLAGATSQNSTVHSAC